MDFVILEGLSLCLDFEFSRVLVLILLVMIGKLCLQNWGLGSLSLISSRFTLRVVLMRES